MSEKYTAKDKRALRRVHKAIRKYYPPETIVTQVLLLDMFFSQIIDDIDFIIARYCLEQGDNISAIAWNQEQVYITA